MHAHGAAAAPGAGARAAGGEAAAAEASAGLLHPLGVYAAGARLAHETRGAGTVAEAMADGRTRISFDSGETHRYKPSSMHKFLPLPPLAAAPRSATGGDTTTATYNNNNDDDDSDHGSSAAGGPAAADRAAAAAAADALAAPPASGGADDVSVGAGEIGCSALASAAYLPPLQVGAPHAAAAAAASPCASPSLPASPRASLPGSPRASAPSSPRAAASPGASERAAAWVCLAAASRSTAAALRRQAVERDRERERDGGPPPLSFQGGRAALQPAGGALLAPTPALHLPSPQTSSDGAPQGAPRAREHE